MPSIEIVPNWHPLVIHFVIVLPLLATLLFVGTTAVPARSRLGSLFTDMARLNLAVGLVAAFAALATGLYAYNTVAHDEAGHANMTRHMYWALGTTAMLGVAAALAWVERRRAAGAGRLLMGLMLVGSGALGFTGWLGGENVYRYGLGVMHMPDPSGHQHGGETASAGMSMPMRGSSQVAPSAAPGGHEH